MLSQWFLNSEFIAEREVPRILKRAAQGKMVVIPLLVEPCDWTDHPYLTDRQVIPGGPLIDYTESSAKFARIRSEILEGLKAKYPGATLALRERRERRSEPIAERVHDIRRFSIAQRLPKPP